MDNNMKKIIVTQERSAINRTQRQKRTLVALGLKRIGQSIEHYATANILSMIKKVNHLVSFKEA